MTDDAVTVRYHSDEAMQGAGVASVIRRNRWRIYRGLLNIRSAALLVVLVILGLIVAPDRADGHAFQEGALFGMVMAAFALYLASYSQTSVLREAQREAHDRHGETVLTLSADGVDQRHGAMHSHIGWPAVHLVEEYRGGVLIFFTLFGFWPVPDDALPDGVTRADLLARIARWRGGAA